MKLKTILVIGIVLLSLISCAVEDGVSLLSGTEVESELTAEQASSTAADSYGRIWSDSFWAHVGTGYSSIAVDDRNSTNVIVYLLKSDGTEVHQYKEETNSKMVYYTGLNWDAIDFYGGNLYGVDMNSRTIKKETSKGNFTNIATLKSNFYTVYDLVVGRGWGDISILVKDNIYSGVPKLYLYNNSTQAWTKSTTAPYFYYYKRSINYLNTNNLITFDFQESEMCFQQNYSPVANNYAWEAITYPISYTNHNGQTSQLNAFAFDISGYYGFCYSYDGITGDIVFTNSIYN